MNLETLFESLAFGELGQHKFGKDGAIAQADYPALISHVNRALTTLHTRFPLQHREVLLLQFDELTDYVLDPKYSISAGDPSVTDKYIIDTIDNPFLDDILRIEQAYNSDGELVPLNDEFRLDSWYLPNPDTVQIPYPVAGNSAAIVYRANHTKIALDTLVADAADTKIILPVSLETALSSYIASRVFISLGNESSARLSSFYSNIYKGEIAQVDRLNLLRSSESDTNIRFVNGGWV